MEETVFQWEKTSGDEACILAGYGTSPFVVVPEEMEGFVVTAIGDYCFSDSKFIQGVSLPASVKRIGNLAFYNCMELQELTMGAALTEFGSDAFMNCQSLETVRIRCGVSEKNGLKQLLSQRTSDTEVFFERDGRTEAVLFYPEYYEVYDEVGPAHIFALNITGEGFRARQCFRDGIVDLAQYDRIFEQASAEESPAALCRMAVNRLCYPVGLSREAGERYQSCILQREDLLVQKLVKSRRLELLEILFREKLLTEAGREKSIRSASEQDWPEGAAAMLRIRHKAAAVSDRYSFE